MYLLFLKIFAGFLSVKNLLMRDLCVICVNFQFIKPPVFFNQPAGRYLFERT